MTTFNIDVLRNLILLRLLLCLAALAIASESAIAKGNPSFAEQPIVVEYDVDPSWPDRPEDVSPFGWVSGIAIDGKNQVWIFNRGPDPIQVYTTEGEFVRTWGKGQFQDAHQLRVGPEGNIWVADFGLHIVQKYTPEGELLLTLGVRGEKGEDETHFNMPTDMAITPAGDIFVTDGYGNRRIVHLDKDGKFIKAWGEYGSAPGQFVLPHAIAVDSKGLLYVADRNSGRIQVFNQEGKFLSQWPNMIMPWGLSMTEDDQLWVCGSTPHWWVRNGKAPEFKDQIFIRFNLEGVVQQVWSIPLGDVGPDRENPDTSKLKPGEAVGIHCMTRDSQGNLYVGDIYGERAQKFQPVSQRQAEEAIPDNLPK